MPENLFTTEYLFATTAPTSKITFFVLLGVYVIYIVLAYLISISKKMHKQLKAWVFNYFLTLGIIGVLVSFFRSQSTPHIGTRFAMLVVVFTAIIWYFAIVGYTLAKMPREVKMAKNEEIYQKYLPKKKNK
jgi:uncharacterized membrane protein YdcZ (DUF606 family)